MAIFYYIFMTYGLTNILVFGKIFDKPRTWVSKKSPFLKKLLECMMCLSTWVGILASIFFWSPVMSLKLENTILDWHYGILYPLAIFLDAMFTSGSVWIIHTIQEFFERAFNPQKPTQQE
jgi:hypothetical protein